MQAKTKGWSVPSCGDHEIGVRDLRFKTGLREFMAVFASQIGCVVECFNVDVKAWPVQLLRTVPCEPFEASVERAHLRRCASEFCLGAGQSRSGLCDLRARRLSALVAPRRGRQDMGKGADGIALEGMDFMSADQIEIGCRRFQSDRLLDCSVAGFGDPD